MTARIQVPATAKRGEVIAIRIAIQHPMETGYRHDEMGQPIKANVVNRLVCTYGGREIFRAEMGTGIAANPYLAFFTVAGKPGKIEFSWFADDGDSGFASVELQVEA